jgi:hypothetical protein
MDSDQAVRLLRERLVELSKLPPAYDSLELKEWKQRTDATLRGVLGDDHRKVSEFQHVHFVYHSAGTPEQFREDFESGRASATALLKGVIYDLEVLSERVSFASPASIDPELWEHVGRLVEMEQWAQVASLTAIFVESQIRQWAGRPATEVGEALMTAVLGDAGAFRLGQTPGERQGWHRLGMGFSLAIRNVDTHRIQVRDDEKRYAMGVLGTGSLLLTQLRHEHRDRLGP